MGTNDYTAFDEMRVALGWAMMASGLEAPPPPIIPTAVPPIVIKSAKVAPKAAPKKAAAADDDDELDLGFDDDDEEEAATPAPTGRAAQAAALKQKRDAETEEKKQAALARLAKKEANQRSLCNLEIKPWEAEQDLQALFKKIKANVKREGLQWSENCALVDVAFGIQKIICTAIVAMNLSMDEIIDEMTEDTFVDEIQSMTMTSMSLL